MVQGAEAEVASLRERLAEADTAALSSGVAGGGSTGAGALVMVRKVRALEAQLLEAQRAAAEAKLAGQVSAARQVDSVQLVALRGQLEEERAAAAEELKAHELARVEQVRDVLLLPRRQGIHDIWFLCDRKCGLHRLDRQHEAPELEQHKFGTTTGSGTWSLCACCTVSLRRAASAH